MKKTEADLEKYRIDNRLKMAFFVGGLMAATALALANSQYTPEAFTFIGGLLGGSALEKRL